MESTSTSKNNLQPKNLVRHASAFVTALPGFLHAKICKAENKLSMWFFSKIQFNDQGNKVTSNHRQPSRAWTKKGIGSILITEMEMAVPARKAGEYLTHSLFRFLGVQGEAEGKLKITDAVLKILKMVSRFLCLTRLGSKG
ncbi:MAG: hypothetical protein JJU34_04190 [Lunatimonas sp.]|uniref:hypothetical protein n=1 Tax=Lunatimonas sp. TaxID=2060141 RepID=UPI00263BBE7A|nr:hypothetical protein [Lunatimonas sp.]MCC5936458.1 hypothetical protein [Lunatimonas sp.]